MFQLLAYSVLPHFSLTDNHCIPTKCCFFGRKMSEKVNLPVKTAQYQMKKGRA